jgi:hypothetical protein
VRECVRALVHLAERERAELVHDHRLVGVAGGQRDRSGGRAASEARQRGEDLHELVGPDRPDHSGFREHLGATQGVPDPPCDALPWLGHFRSPSFELTLQILERPLEVAPDHRRRHAVRDHAQHAARGVVGQPQRHPRAAVRGLPEAPATTLVDAGHVGPAEVARLVELDQLHHPAHLGGPDPHAHRETRAEARLGARCHLAPAVHRVGAPLGLAAGHALEEMGVLARVAHALPDPLPRRVDRARALDAHQPSTGRRRSDWSAVSAACMRPITSA